MRGYRDSETRAPGSRPLTRRHGPSQWRREQGRQSNNDGAQVMGQVEKGRIYLVVGSKYFRDNYCLSMIEHVYYFNIV